MATQANASLGAYVPLILSADWWKRYLAGNRSWYLAAAAFVLGYLALFLVGILMNVIGLRGFNWFTGFVVQIAVLIVAASWMHFVAVGGLGFIAGQPGGEAGLSAADGSATAKGWLGKLGRFILHLGLNAPVAFYAIAIWPVKDAPFFAFVVLAASISIALAVPLIFGEGKFWTTLLWFIHLLIVLGAVAFFSAKAIAPEQSKRLANWVEARLSVNDADRTSDTKKEVIRQAHLKLAQECTNKLTPSSTRDEQDRCEALRQNAGVLIYDDPAVRARSEAAKRLYDAGMEKAIQCYQALTRDSTRADKDACDKIRDEAKDLFRTPAAVSAPTATTRVNSESQSPAPTAPVKTAQAEPTWDCTATWKEADYAPSEHQGRMDLGTLPAGRYAIKVAGTVWQDFYTGTPAVFDKRCEADADGRMGDCRTADNRLILNRNGDIWPAPKPIPSASRVHIPGEAYGKVLVHAWGVPLPIGEQGQIHTGQDLPIAVDANFYQHPASYNGPGKFRVTIKQCQRT
jgi:hypothetical protein